ncbi:MAG: AAA family ATPase [Synechococcaceae cyanobacterium SM2_3_1]|nr:AAA family ATPase [Synechococcaceae cyanobacterium SM2_3_1]
MEEILDNIYNSFNPQPLPAGDPAYVDCKEVRGDVDIVTDLGKRIHRSKDITCYLYAGYRGSGKTTELNRLKAYLESKKFHVVYFDADIEDISTQDVEYEDILLACTRHIVEQIKEVDPKPISDWLNDQWNSLKEFFDQQVKLNDLKIEAQIQYFTKLTATIRTEPSQRQRIREKVKPHTETLISALNKFIDAAKDKLPEERKQLIVIVDSLDRIVPNFKDNGRSNHDEIFLDRHEQLKALRCHVLYTVPISMVYSKSSTEVKDNYNFTQILPSIMVKSSDQESYQPGLDKLKEAIHQRVKPHSGELDLETQIFESKEILERMCLMSGGYMRDLIQLAQEAVNRTDELPIQEKAVQRAIDELRSVYQRAVEEPQWEALAYVHLTKEIKNENFYRSLLFNRCLLEYRKSAEHSKNASTWYDVHPILLNTPKLEKAIETLKG